MDLRRLVTQMIKEDGLKEATVYVVEGEGHLGAAKVYKARDDRTFKKTASYTEGVQPRIQPANTVVLCRLKKLSAAPLTLRY